MKIRDIVIGLELHARDAALLHYTKSFCNILKPEQIRYVNIHEEIRLPKSLTAHFPNAKKELSNLYIKEMVEKTEKVFIPKTNVIYEALENDTLTELLKLTNEKSTDILAIGIRDRQEDRSLAYRKLVRKSSCNVLVVPENARPRFKQIVVAIDFSDYSKLALEEAIEIALKTGGEITCQHIYEVPTSYHKLNKTFVEAAQIIKDVCFEEFNKLIKNIDLKGVRVEPVFTLNEHNSTTEALVGFCQENNTDLIVLGSKGHSTLGSLLLGSTAETILDYTTNIPVFFVKTKGKNIDIIEEFSKI